MGRMRRSSTSPKAPTTACAEGPAIRGRCSVLRVTIPALAQARALGAGGTRAVCAVVASRCADNRSVNTKAVNTKSVNTKSVNTKSVNTKFTNSKEG